MQLIAFDAIDVLGRFATLAKRSPTLDGGVPVRVAQGCVPLLEGNAWGHQISLSQRLAFRRGLGGWRGEVPAELDRLARAAVPMLVKDRTLRPGAWIKRLERGVVDGTSVFTGLFVRPRAGYRLRVSTLANRRSWAYGVEEAILDDTEAFTPLMLDLAPAADAFALDGEVATLAVLPARTSFATATLAGAPEIAAAHTAFYDERYFATKKSGEVARKYRDDVVRPQRDELPGDGEPAVTVVQEGEAFVEPAAPSRFHRSHGAVAGSGPPDRLVMKNAVALAASFDGYRLTVTPDADELARFAAAVRAQWQGVAMFEGALLYFTKYVTPHPPGEPHFFVKPPALIASSPGTSTVIDGISGRGHDVMRGVVRTDAFHAAPAVFHLWRPGETIRIARGAPLAQLFTCPRALDDARFELSAAGPAGAWA